MQSGAAQRSDVVARMTRPAQLPITTAEREVLQALADGAILKALADERRVSYQCIVRQTAMMRRKLRANSMEHAVAIGIRRGLVTL